MDMEAVSELDTDANSKQPSQDRVTTFSYLISEAHVYWVVPSGTYDSMGTPLHGWWSLTKEINCSSVHCPLTTKDLKFPGGVLSEPPPSKG